MQLQNIINMNHYLSQVGYEISPIYFMQIYYYGYGIKKDIVETCAWANNVNKNLINKDLIDLIKKIDSIQLNQGQDKQFKELTAIYKERLSKDYESWLKNNSIVYKSEALKILNDYNIKF